MSDETEGQEPQQQDPQAQPETPSWDEEKKRYEQQLAQERAQREQLAARYQQDVGTLSAYVQSFQQQAQAQPEEEIDEDTPEGRKRARELLQRQLQQAQEAHTTSQYQALRAISRNSIAQKYGKDWERWGAEAEQMLNQYPVQIAASPESYEAALRAVKAMHADEILEEKKQEWLAQRAQEDSGEEEFGGAGSLPSPQPTGAPPIRHTASPVRGVAPGKKREKGPWDALPRESQQWLKERGMTAEDYNKYSNPKYEADILGFKGRNVIGDEDYTAYHNR